MQLPPLDSPSTLCRGREFYRERIPLPGYFFVHPAACEINSADEQGSLANVCPQNTHMFVVILLGGVVALDDGASCAWGAH